MLGNRILELLVFILSFWGRPPDPIRRKRRQYIYPSARPPHPRQAAGSTEKFNESESKAKIKIEETIRKH